MSFIYLWIAAQIIGEMLPISSSGHLALLECFLKKYKNFDIHAFFEKQKVPIKDVYYFLHVPTLIVITLYFGMSWISLVFHKGSVEIKPIIWVFIADCIVALFYFGLQRIKVNFPLIIGFIITVLALFFTAFCSVNGSNLEWQYHDALLLGIAQGIALLPGISRLAFTCAAGCWLGYSLVDSFFLSWTIQAPLMAAACAKSIIDLIRSGKLAQLLNPRSGLVMLVSGIASGAAFMLMVYMIHANTFFWWGLYMFIPMMFWFMVRDPSTGSG